MGLDNTRSICCNFGSAVLVSSTLAQLFPKVYSALPDDEKQPESPVTGKNIRTVLHVLGRREYNQIHKAASLPKLQ